MSDQHNAACMSHAGRSVRTPTLDWLAAAGVRFINGFCNNPICAPSRISFVTGQYPHIHRHLGNNVRDYPVGNRTTIAALARRHGYQTAQIGKAHMPHGWNVEGYEYLRYCDLCDAERDDPLTTHYFRYLYDHGIADLYDFGTLPPGHPGRLEHSFVSRIPHEHSIEVWTGNETLAFLKGRDRRRPFFCHMSFQRPHPPYAPSFERAALYRTEDVDLPPGADELRETGFASKPAFQRAAVARGRSALVPADEGDLRLRLSRYFALITIIDEQIGRVVDYLRAEGELEHTVICYVADHGDFAGDHGLVNKNFGIYESIHRIPYLLYYPGCPAGAVVDGLVESVDLYPTLCALMDVEAPAGVEGRSLLPGVSGESAGKDAVFCEWSWGPAGRMVHAVRTPDYRLVYYGAGADGELYDRRTDPGEATNRYRDPEYRAVRLDLLERLADHIAHYGKESDTAQDRRIDHQTRNSVTRQIHKGMKRWPDLAPLYVP
jgi:arylsulfatase A-like enzyme